MDHPHNNVPKDAGRDAELQGVGALPSTQMSTDATSDIPLEGNKNIPQLHSSGETLPRPNDLPIYSSARTRPGLINHITSSSRNSLMHTLKRLRQTNDESDGINARTYTEMDEWRSEGYSTSYAAKTSDAMSEIERKKAKILTTLESAIPSHKLENLSSYSVKKTSVLFGLLLLLAIIYTIVYSLMLENLESHYSIEHVTYIRVILYFQLSIHFCANFTLLFLFVSFPQRVLVRLYRDKIIPTAEQTLILTLLIILNIVPVFSIGTLVCNFEAVAYFESINFERCLEYHNSSCTDLETSIPIVRRQFNISIELAALASYSAEFYECQEKNKGLILYNTVMIGFALGYIALFILFMARLPWLTKHEVQTKSPKKSNRTYRMDNRLRKATGRTGHDGDSKERKFESVKEINEIYSSEELESAQDYCLERVASSVCICLNKGCGYGCSFISSSCSKLKSAMTSSSNSTTGHHDDDTRENKSIKCCSNVCNGSADDHKCNSSTCIREFWSATKTMYSSLVPGVTPLIFLSVLFYVIYMWAVCFAFDIYPSLVPVVEVITIFRVCLHKRVDQDLQESAYFCKPGTIGYRRAIAMTIAVVYEIFIFIYLPARYLASGYKQLSRLPYAVNRTKHLSYRYFQVITLTAIFVLLAISIVLLFIPPVWTWILNEVEVNVMNTSERVYSIDPLFVVGVAGSTPGFVSYYIVLVAWLVMLAYAYLPEDSHGFRGWFVGVKTNRNRYNDLRNKAQGKCGEKISSNCIPHLKALKKPEHLAPLPLYIVFEKDAYLLSSFIGLESASASSTNYLGLVDNSTAEEAPVRHSHSKSISSDTKLKINTRSGSEYFNKHTQSPTPIIRRKTIAALPISTRKRTAIQAILKNHMFVMELAIVAFNFADAVYELDKTKSLEGNSGVIFDKDYKLEAYIHNDATDTHCLIAKSRDRIIVAFRGTVSSTNIRTDLSFDLSSYPAAQEIARDGCSEYDYVENESFSVHKGFMKAYQSVSKAVETTLKRLLVEDSSLVTVFTGHSLGAGLAVLCAFETKYTLQLQEVGCITFGAPKIGCSNFKILYDKFIPYTMRFVVIRDIIPALRSPSPLHFRSYYHVGIEIAMDFSGMLIFRPNFIERTFLLQFRRHTTGHHYMSRYALALMIWNIRSHIGEYEPDFWISVNNKVLGYCDHIIRYLDPVVRETLKERLKKEGVVYSGKNSKNKLREMGVQTSDIGLYDDMEESLIRSIEDIVDRHDQISGDNDKASLLKELKALCNSQHTFEVV